MSFESFSYNLSLLESKAQLKQQLSSGKIDQDTFDNIVNLTPKELSKYLGWIGKQKANDDEVSISKIVDLLNWFEKNKPRIGNKDIEKYDLSSLQSIHDNLGKSKSQKEKQAKEEGAKLIEETPTHLLYRVFNHEASCYYGSGTKWCITGSNPNNPEGDDEGWQEYKDKLFQFLFLIEKGGDIEDIYYKIALVGKFKDNTFYLINAFDSTDKLIDNETITKIIEKSSIKYNIYYQYFSGKYVDELPLSLRSLSLMSKEDILNLVINGSYTMSEDGSVDVNGDVVMVKHNLTQIPVNFNKVTGDFYCNSNQLTSLEGAPKSVGGAFDCSNNRLTSLEGAPKSVGRNFYCNSNQLTSLEGAPKSVTGDFYCNSNQLTSLEGAPKSVGHNFYCVNNKVKFTEEQVRTVSDVKGYIEV